MTYPRVTIGVPIYGVEKYIERCAISVLNQSYSNIEFIFCDDCTPDRSVQILENVVNNYSSRIKTNIKIIRHEVNKGLAAARNSIIRNASGDFIFWVDSDDYIEENAIELTVASQLSTDADIVNVNYQEEYGCYVRKKQHPVVSSSRDYSIQMISRRAPINIWGRLIRLSLYLDNDLYVKEVVDMGEDYQISTRLAYYSQKVECLDRILYHFNCTNLTSYTKSGVKNKQADESFKIVKDFFYNKGSDFADAISVATLNMSVDFIYYYKAKSWAIKENIEKISSIDRRFWKYVVWYKRIILYLINVPLILRIYIITSSYLKSVSNYFLYCIKS